MIKEWEIFGRLVFCDIRPDFYGEPELVGVTDYKGDNVTLSESVWDKLKFEVLSELNAAY